MHRREFLHVGAAATAGWLLFPACRVENAEEKMPEAPGVKIERLEKPLSEWRKILKPEQYAVLFEEATERPFSSPLNEEKRFGPFICAACRLPLFSSDAKYGSGTGWPSFFRPLEGRIGTKRDFRLVLPRMDAIHRAHVDTGRCLSSPRTVPR